MRTTLLLALAATAVAAFAQTSPATQGPQPLTLPTLKPTQPLLRSPDEARLQAALVARPLTIDDAVAVALLTSRPFARSIAQLEEARGRTSEVRAGLNPSFGLNGTYTAYTAPINANFAGTTIPIQRQFVGIYTAGVTLPLDISGTIRAAVGQAQFSEVAARIDVNRTRNDLVYNVRNAFYQALRAQGQLVVAQDSLRNTQERLQDAQANLAAGTGTQFDVLTAQRDVADAQGNLVNARGNVTVALAQLKNTIGIDVSVPLTIVDAGAVEDPGTSAPEPAPVRIESYGTAKDEVALGDEYQSAVAEAVRTRPEILEGNAAVSAAERGVAYARRSRLPSLSVTAGYTVQPNFAGFTPANQGSLGLGFSIPIYDAGLARARDRQARAQVAAAQIDQRTSIDQVTLDVQTAYVNRVQAQERVRVATLAVTQAQEAFRLAQLRARAGVSATPTQSPQIELSNAQNALALAQTNRVNALYDYNVARTALERAVGRYSYGPAGADGMGGYSAPPTEKVTGRNTPTAASNP